MGLSRHAEARAAQPRAHHVGVLHGLQDQSLKRAHDCWRSRKDLHDPVAAHTRDDGDVHLAHLDGREPVGGPGLDSERSQPAPQPHEWPRATFGGDDPMTLDRQPGRQLAVPRPDVDHRGAGWDRLGDGFKPGAQAWA